MSVGSKNESIKISVNVPSRPRYRPRINYLPGTRDGLKAQVSGEFHDHKCPFRIHSHFHILLRTEIMGSYA
jgi:hypothetical protein